MYRLYNALYPERVDITNLPFHSTLTFLKKSFDGCVPVMELATDDEELVARVTKELRAFNQGLDKMKYV